MKARALQIIAPGDARVLPVDLRAPGDDEVLVATLVSALSAGSERLVFNGEVEATVPLDATLPGREQPLRYPLTYGYCNVGRVVRVGARVPGSWVGARVFGFQPHQDLWVADHRQVVRLPESVSAEHGALLANTETAVSLVMDGAPLLGEAVAVVGLGVVGQLVAGILSHVGLGRLSLVDPRASRLEVARALCGTGVEARLGPGEGEGASDLVFELSGNPAALDTALALCRREGRVVVGSWYGTRSAPLHLGTRVHRGRQTIVFSQVSELASGLTGRFDKARRLAVALEWLGKLPLERLITHRVPFDSAPEAYRLIEEEQGCLQVVLTYPPMEA
jgi:2-desacetyl-2-hydroxyethyl bacteriochlorophyllide A dehydrogenase